MIGRVPAELVGEMRSLPLRLEVMEKRLWRNAARVLGIGPEAVQRLA